jgi:hypothetical protein
MADRQSDAASCAFRWRRAFVGLRAGRGAILPGTVPGVRRGRPRRRQVHHVRAIDLRIARQFESARLRGSGIRRRSRVNAAALWGSALQMSTSPVGRSRPRTPANSPPGNASCTWDAPATSSYDHAAAGDRHATDPQRSTDGGPGSHAPTPRSGGAGGRGLLHHSGHPTASNIIAKVSRARQGRIRR